MLTNSKKIGIAIVAFIVVGIAVGAVISSSSTPDFDAIIENRDCDAVRALTDLQFEKATAGQQLSLTVLIATCR